MPVQVFGTKKCKETQKALRYFKERRINPQFIDLAEKEISLGELRNISRSVALKDLIDSQGKEYEKLGLNHMKFDLTEKLLAHPLLFKTPIVRCGNHATVGYTPEQWGAFL